MLNARGGTMNKDTMVSALVAFGHSKTTVRSFLRDSGLFNEDRSNDPKHIVSNGLPLMVISFIPPEAKRGSLSFFINFASQELSAALAKLKFSETDRLAICTRMYDILMTPWEYRRDVAAGEMVMRGVILHGIITHTSRSYKFDKRISKMLKHVMQFEDWLGLEDLLEVELHECQRMDMLYALVGAIRNLEETRRIEGQSHIFVKRHFIELDEYLGGDIVINAWHREMVALELGGPAQTPFLIRHSPAVPPGVNFFGTCASESARGLTEGPPPIVSARGPDLGLTATQIWAHRAFGNVGDFPRPAPHTVPPPPPPSQLHWSALPPGVHFGGQLTSGFSTTGVNAVSGMALLEKYRQKHNQRLKFQGGIAISPTAVGSHAKAVTTQVVMSAVSTGVAKYQLPANFTGLCMFPAMHKVSTTGVITPGTIFGVGGPFARLVVFGSIASSTKYLPYDNGSNSAFGIAVFPMDTTADLDPVEFAQLAVATTYGSPATALSLPGLVSTSPVSGTQISTTAMNISSSTGQVPAGTWAVGLGPVSDRLIQPDRYTLMYPALTALNNQNTQWGPYWISNDLTGTTCAFTATGSQNILMLASDLNFNNATAIATAPLNNTVFDLTGPTDLIYAAEFTIAVSATVATTASVVAGSYYCTVTTPYLDATGTYQNQVDSYSLPFNFTFPGATASTGAFTTTDSVTLPFVPRPFAQIVAFGIQVSTFTNISTAAFTAAQTLTVNTTLPIQRPSLTAVGLSNATVTIEQSGIYLLRLDQSKTLIYGMTEVDEQAASLRHALERFIPRLSMTSLMRRVEFSNIAPLILGTHDDPNLDAVPAPVLDVAEKDEPSKTFILPFLASLLPKALPLVSRGLGFVADQVGKLIGGGGDDSNAVDVAKSVAARAASDAARSAQRMVDDRVQVELAKLASRDDDAEDRADKEFMRRYRRMRDMEDRRGADAEAARQRALRQRAEYDNDGAPMARVATSYLATTPRVTQALERMASAKKKKSKGKSTTGVVASQFFAMVHGKMPAAGRYESVRFRPSVVCLDGNTVQVVQYGGEVPEDGSYQVDVRPGFLTFSPPSSTATIACLTASDAVDRITCRRNATWGVGQDASAPGGGSLWIVMSTACPVTQMYSCFQRVPQYVQVGASLVDRRLAQSFDEKQLIQLAHGLRNSQCYITSWCSLDTRSKDHEAMGGSLASAILVAVYGGAPANLVFTGTPFTSTPGMSDVPALTQQKQRFLDALSTDGNLSGALHLNIRTPLRLVPVVGSGDCPMPQEFGPTIPQLVRESQA
jgi:hypothetical protein